MGDDNGKHDQGALGNRQDSEDGRATLDDLLRDRPHLVSLLDSRDVVERQPGAWLFQEGEEVTQFAYIVMGKVNIFTAGEATGEVRSQELLGVAEFLLRDENPRYTKAAQVVEPTFLLWMDERGLKIIADIERGAVPAYMRLKARIERHLEEAIRRLKTEKSKLEVRVAQLGVALGKVQDSLATRPSFPPRPSKVAPPPPPKRPPLPTELLGKLEKTRRTNRELVKLFERRAQNLASLLEALRAVVAAHPDWAKRKDFAAFVERVEALALHDSNIEIVIPP